MWAGYCGDAGPFEPEGGSSLVSVAIEGSCADFGRVLLFRCGGELVGSPCDSQILVDMVV